jgi:hypothetical protein
LDWLKPFQFPAIADFLELQEDIQFRQQSLDGRAISVAFQQAPAELLAK